MKVRFEIETEDAEEIRKISEALARIKADGARPKRMKNTKLKTNATKPGLKRPQAIKAKVEDPKPVTAKVVVTKKQKLTDRAFIKLWNSSESYAVIIEATGKKRNSVANRATRLRKLGHQVKYFGSPNAGRRSPK